jgi:hypothetical protein
VAASGQPLGVVFALEGELPDARLESHVLLCEAGLLPGALRVVKSLGGRRQTLVAPLIREGLTDLMRRTQLRHRLPLQTRDGNHRFGLGVPRPALHG